MSIQPQWSVEFSINTFDNKGRRAQYSDSSNREFWNLVLHFLGSQFYKKLYYFIEKPFQKCKMKTF